ncbi:MAG: DUF2203 family protein [Gemmataceae bacterium]
MSEFLGDTASSASEKPGRPETAVTLSTARRMLPLVRHIVDEIVQTRQELGKLFPEQGRLHKLRHNLAWPDRERRYQVQDDICQREATSLEALAELESLGVVLMDGDTGRVGFPTTVNGHRAFFSWQPGEDGIRRWHYAGEVIRRNIPPAWEEAIEKPTSNSRR